MNCPTSTLQDATGPSLAPTIQGTFIISTQVGAQSIVHLSGLELTVRIEYAKTISFYGYITLFTSYKKLSVNSACPTPTIVVL